MSRSIERLFIRRHRYPWGDLVARATAVVAAVRRNVQGFGHEYVFKARTDDDLLQRLPLLVGSGSGLNFLIHDVEH